MKIKFFLGEIKPHLRTPHNTFLEIFCDIILFTMIITAHGAESIKISHGDLTIALNPISKKSKLKATSYGADMAFITTWHPDMNGVDTIARNGKEPFVIKGPGEYEVSGLFAKGFRSVTTHDGIEAMNTIYTFILDDINVAFLGALGEKDLDPEVKEQLGEADIIFVPIGGEGTLNFAEAYDLALKREAKIIIPIHHDGVGAKDALKNFLKEAGQEDVKPVDKLTIKRKDIIDKTGEVVVIM